ncbi:MAG TPA: tyrosine-type recombinase/integrase [Syntrophales bacterium]|nr:tyrosine-type recombinase/integrase [Syntrophales bacterium]
MQAKTRNMNHPPKGSMIRVDPIRSIKDIKSIRKLLADQPRNLALFILGTNTNLRASDILAIKAGQVRGLKPMDEIELRERKTGKLRRITLNKLVVEAITALLAAFPYHDDDLLFRGQRGTLTVPSLNRLVKSWCTAVNLQGNFGSHTLRKTWGYHQRVTFGRSLPELMVCFNHSTQKQTLDYLCIQPEEIRSIYANEI